MAGFNWDDYEEAKVPAPVAASPASFDWNSFEAEKKGPSQLEAGLRGAAQGASLGLTDEIAGLGGAIGHALGSSGVDKITSTHPEVEKQLRQIESEAPGVSDVYTKSRNEERAKNLEASQAHPGTYLAGNIVGGVANPAFSGAASLPKLAGAGAVQGLGLSEADLQKGELSQAAKDVALGAGGGAVGYGVSKVVPKVLEGAGWAGKKALTTFGPTEEAINARLAGRANSETASYPALAEKMGGSLKKLQAQIGEASRAANQKLSSEPTIPKVYATTNIDDALKNLKVNGKLIGPTDKSAASFLENLKGDMEGLGDNLSQKDLKTLIQKMDDNINWGDQGSQKLNNILKGIRNEFDKTLKFQNSDYKQAMTPVSVKMKILENAKKQFNFQHSPGEGLVPTDTTASKIQHSLSENKAMTQKNLGLLERHTGDDYLGAAKDYQLAKQFENTGAQGSRRTVLGGALGGALGHSVIPGVGGTGGGALGALTGATLDKYGGQALGKMIDSYVAAGNSKVFGKFAPVVEKLAAQGPAALAVGGSILGSNPEFQKIIQSLSPNK